MKYDYERIRKNIELLLEAHGESQATLADRMGVSIRQVSRWINGEKGEAIRIPQNRLMQLADHFNMSVESLTETSLSDDFDTRYSTLSDSIEKERALIKYLEALGISFEWIGMVSENAAFISPRKIEKTRPLFVIANSHNLTNHKFCKPKGDFIDRPKWVRISWNDSSETRLIKTISFDAFARKFHALAMLEIKHIY